MKISEFVISTKSNVQAVIKDNLSQHYLPFSDINNFPRVKGIYFIYDKAQDLDTPIYIGCTPLTVVKKRCRQYISASDTGGDSFRDKVFKVYEMENTDSVIPYIIENFQIKYIDVNELNVSDINLLERACISCESSSLPLNDYRDRA